MVIDDCAAIERGIPVPARVQKRSLPWGDLGVEESFVVRDRARGTVHNLAYRWGKRLGRRFTVRREGDAMRVWRVK